MLMEDLKFHFYHLKNFLKILFKFLHPLPSKSVYLMVTNTVIWENIFIVPKWALQTQEILGDYHIHGNFCPSFWESD